MESHTYKYFNKYFVQFNSNKVASEIENMTAVNIEIKIMRDVIDMFEKTLQQKETQLNDANVQLSNTDQERLIIRDAFCCQVWNFSYEHKFLNMFEHYPYIINPIKFHNCQYITTIDENIKDEYNSRAGTQNYEHVQNLEQEIIILKKEMYTIITSKNTEVVIQNFSIKLGHLKLFSEEMVKLLKLIDNIENLDDNKFNKNVLKCKNYNTLTNTNRDNMLTFTKAKILLGQYNSHLHVLSEKDNMPSNMIMENNNATGYFIIDNKKQFMSKFSVKTQSNISLKFEQKRSLKEKEREC